jgi:hypothetical protein
MTGEGADFYTDVRGFAVKRHVPMGEARWLTVVTGEPNYFLSLRAAWPKPPGFQKAPFNAAIYFRAE